MTAAVLGGLVLLSATADAAAPPPDASSPALPPPTVAPTGGIEIVHLANAGVVVKDGSRSVLIDGCVREPYSGYAAVSDAVWRQLVAGEPPFADLDLVLVSHGHRDHFQVAAARELLLARPGAAWVVHREVANALAEDWARWSEVAPRVVAVAPVDGEPARWRVAGLDVELWRLPHGNARTMPENLAHVVRFGAGSVLHVGDAGASAADLRRAGLTGHRFDVALLPYWYWLGDEWRVARTMLGGRLGSVAIHLPPGEPAPVAPAGEPAPRVFTAPLEQLRF